MTLTRERIEEAQRLFRICNRDLQMKGELENKGLVTLTGLFAEYIPDLLAAAKRWVEASTAFQEGYGIADYEERIAALEKENAALKKLVREAMPKVERELEWNWRYGLEAARERLYEWITRAEDILGEVPRKEKAK